MKNRFVAAISLIACSPAALVFAQESATTEPIIVTATRTARTVDDTLAAVTVLTRQDIERTQAQTVPELLRALPGMDVAILGGYGKQTSAFLRGTESDHVLVLIDGIRVGSASSGTTAWELLPLEQIEHIEIVRGPRSGLYGADAIGGVVQIFTRQADAEPQVHAEAETGSHDSRRISAGTGGSVGGFRYNVDAARFSTDGINATRPTGTPYSVDEPDADAYDNDSLSARLGYRFGQNGDIEGHVMRSSGRSEYDGDFQNEVDFVQQTAGLRLGVSPTSRWRATVSAGEARDEADNLKDGVFQSTFDTQRRTLAWQNDLTLSERQSLTLGVDRQEDRISSTTAYAVTARDNSGVFAQYQASGERNSLVAAVRRDDNDQFGTHDTGHAAYGYRMGNGMQVRASYGTAFHAPSFNDLYYPGFSNPNLQPEESETVEVGLSATGNAKRAWSVAVFHTRVDNLIAFDAAFIPQNIDRATIDGIEAEYTLMIGRWTTRTSVTLLDARDDATGQRLPKRAKAGGRVDLDRRLGRDTIGLSLIAQGARYEYTPSNVRLPGYAIVDLRYQHQLAKAWSLRARVENALDKDYETVHGYNMPDRMFFLSLAYRSS